MQEYEVKRGHAKNTDLKQIFELAFGTYREEDGWLVGAFGAMKMIKAIAPRVAKGDQEAFKLAQETQRRWNDFLETATAYDAKMRGKKAQAAVKKAEVPEV